MSAIAFEAMVPQLDELTPTMAERWVAAALALARALHEHDGWLYPVDPKKLPAAKQLHNRWRRWTEDAEALLQRIQALAPARISGVDLLCDEIGRIGSMLGLPPELIAQRHEQVLRGEVRSLEEVRRELRASRSR
jgi:hypothetical protein